MDAAIIIYGLISVLVGFMNLDSNSFQVVITRVIFWPIILVKILYIGLKEELLE